MPSEITSVQNPRVKTWSQLLTRKGRNAQGKFLLEGTHLVEEALKSGIAVETVLYSLEKEFPDWLHRLSGDTVEWVGVTGQVLAKCTETPTPQGVVAIGAQPVWSAADLLAAPQSLAVVVDGVQDPGNLGTIIRSADAVGAAGVFLGEGTVDIYNPKTVRATMGSLFHVPVVEADLPKLLAQARAQGVRVIGTDLGATESCYAADMTAPAWIVVGNEGSGMSPAIRPLVDRLVKIPMRGRAESLNVAMAATVLLFEAVRQRHHRD